MALPFSPNPNNKSWSKRVQLRPGCNNFCMSYGSTSGVRQRRPFNLHTPYGATYSEVTGITNEANAFLCNSDATALFDVYGEFKTQAVRVRNRAYEKMRNSLYSSAAIGASLAEYNQSLQMIALRGGQLLRAFRAVRRGEVFAALRYFQLSPDLQSAYRWKKTRSASNLWLELHFGWTPLVKDIYEACHVISNPINAVWAKGAASEPIGLNRRVDHGWPLSLRYTTVVNGSVRSLQMCTGVITNPNLHLAEQMGLINPASVAWERVPFSFVVDWFANVGQYLSSLSDFSGMSISDAYHTDSFKINHLEQVDAYDYPFTGNYKTDAINKKSSFMNRAQGLISPVLTYKGISLPSSTRAATAISLLGQALGQHTRKLGFT